MIVPDGRTDPEKLKELLGNPEETHLDLKAAMDLTDTESKLNFVKDAVTMSQRRPGGYILIGVDNDGNPCLPIGTIKDRARYDGSEQLSIPVDRGVSGDLRSGVLIAV